VLHATFLAIAPFQGLARDGISGSGVVKRRPPVMKRRWAQIYDAEPILKIGLKT
jgi:hypothetical protein